MMDHDDDGSLADHCGTVLIADSGPGRLQSWFEVAQKKDPPKKNCSRLLSSSEESFEHKIVNIQKSLVTHQDELSSN